ncbi:MULTISPECIES: YhdP family protein [Luteimonas]|uniref:YhdP family protein n=1 Tax=Luteimonas TaxID=83614 RepID=UPI000C798348|nr:MULTISPECIES: YhdP family protein [Luteimonas]
MTTAWATRLRRARHGGGLLVAAVLVTMALAAIAASQLLPWAERHPDRVEAWLSARAGRPVAFETLRTEWTRRGPLLRVTGLRIGDPDAAVPVDEAEIQVAQYSGLLPGRSLTELRLRGLALTLQRDDDGRWQLLGLPGAAHPGDDPLEALEGLGELQVIAARLTVDAPSLGLQHTLPRIDLRLQVDGREARGSARAWIEADGQPVDVRLALQRGDGSGRAYIAMPRNDLQVWSPLLAATGVAIASGHGHVRAWLDLREKRVVAVTADVALDTIALQRADAVASGATDAHRVTFDGMTARGRWTVADGDWRVDAPTLRVVHQGREQVLDGLLLAGGRRIAMQAERVEIAPVLALAALADGVSPGLRDWLQAAAPHALLTDVELAADRGGPLRIAARVASLGFSPVGVQPGLDGLGGTLSGDADGVVFAFDPAARPVFDWPAGFGVAHPLRLDGTLAGWRDGAGWHVGTPALRVEGDGYAADARIELWFQGDGTRPRMDLAARVDTAQIPVAKKFWVRHRMPQAARTWLDMALVAGEVRDGRGIVAGELEDWPFSAIGAHGTRGVFVAEGRIADATVRFQDDWPALQALDGDLRFVNDGFRLTGATGRLDEVEVRDIEGGIPQYGRSGVTVQARADGDAARLLALLRASPFESRLGDTLARLRVSGPAAADVTVAVPLGAAAVIDGRVQLDGIAAEDTGFDIAFQSLRGLVGFDQRGFSADALDALRGGQAGRLSLRAGDGHVRDGAQAFEADLAMPLSTRDLLSRAPDLAWLQPLAAGRSPWTVAVSVPKTRAGGVEARLRLHSDLVGTTLSLPAPLDKPAARALRTTVETPLPFGSGDIDVAFGERLALRARTSGGRTGIRVALGTGRVDSAPPAAGLVIGGRTPVVDLIDWFGLAGGSAGGGDGLALAGVDLVADDLQLLGGRFGPTRITAAQRGGTTEVAFDGAALAGTLRAPQATGTPVEAHLQRLHWQAPPRPDTGAATGTARRAPPAPDDDALDPAALPPIHVVVDDLRFNTLPLGTASVQTRQVPGGLEVEHLRVRAPGQQIDVAGHWTGRGADASTRFTADVESADFGALASGLGFAGSIQGGQGRVDFDASWPGAPTAFDVTRVRGAMTLAIKDGQLVEVEPGAGRVLGLLSVAELPRRLMLDFRDFFNKGLGFNRIGGDVRFGDAHARSDNLVIEAPAAEIRISGSSDLQARTHDQAIEVLPRTGNLLPAVGALTAGPVGAAVGAVANAVLRRPLGELGAKTYHVSGPWQDPQVDVVDRRGTGTTSPPPTRPRGPASAD